MVLVVKPPWVSHDGMHIFSISVHPNEPKFATAGQDQKIKIWDLKCICEEDSANDGMTEKESGPRRLATIYLSQSVPMAIKWSPNGKYLAVGADDHMVYVYEKSSEPMNVRFSASGEDRNNVENYRLVRSLFGHSGDVLDVAWSPRNLFLASCSVDNKIIIWDAEKKFEKVTELSGHTGFVNGIAFDPVGQYLASQSDDKSLILWRVNGWQRETVVSDLFRHTPSEAYYFRRPSWSPDGLHLATPLAQKQSFNVVVLLKRDRWTSAVDFVGHEKAATVTSFCPALFRATSSTSSLPYSLIAVGSLDTNVTIWASNLPRPKLILKEIFESCVTDLSWSSDGTTVVACSLDGTITYAEFGVEELGVPVPVSETQDQIRSNFRDILNLGTSSEQLIVERPLPIQGEEPESSLRAAKGASAGVDGKAVSPVVKHAQPDDDPDAITLTPRRRKKKRLLSERLGPAEAGDGHGQGESDVKRQAPSPPSTAPAEVNVLQPSSSSHRLIPVRKGERRSAARVGTSESLSAGIPSRSTTGDAHMETEAAGHVAITINEIGPLAIPPPDAPRMPLTARCVLGHETILLSYSSSVVTASVGGVKRWSTHAPNVTHLAASPSVIVMGISDGTVLTYSPAGRRINPPFALGSPVCFLSTTNEGLLLVLTCDGTLRVWNMVKRVVVCCESIRPLLGSTPRPIASAGILPGNLPIVVLKSGESFTFHPDLKVWIRLADASLRGADFFSSPLPWKAQVEHGIVSKLADRVAHVEPQVTRALLTSDPELQAMDSIAFLEHQICIAKLLNSAGEYKQWLLLYLRKCAEIGAEEKVRELIRSVLEPLLAKTSESELGIHRKEWVEIILSELRGLRGLERVANETREQMAHLHS